MKNKKQYNTNDLIKIFGLSRQRFEQFRHGHMNHKTKKGKFVLYKVEPVLTEGIDWYYEGVHVLYNQSTVEKIKKKISQNKNRKPRKD